MKKKSHLNAGMAEPPALLLYLIREELKSRKFFSGLQRLGLDYCFFQPHLDKPILDAIGLHDPTDEEYQFYFRLIERRSRKIREDEDSITAQASKVYHALVQERRERLRGRTQDGMSSNMVAAANEDHLNGASVHCETGRRACIR